MKKIGSLVNSCGPRIGISERPGRAIGSVGTPVEMPDGMITSDRRNPVIPRASRLMTTPEMIWFTRRLTLSSGVQEGDEARR